MSYQIETIDNCTKKIVFNFEEIDLSAKVNEALLGKQKTTNLKGFRKGKAPLDMIRKLYGPQAENEALSKFVSEQFVSVLEKEKLHAIGSPEFGNTQYEPGKKISFEAKVEIYPEFSLKDMAGLSFEKKSEDVADEDIKKIQDQLLEQKAQMVEVKDKEKTLDKGQFAVLNFQGERPSGERPQSMKGEEFLLEIGSGSFIPGFEEQLIGLKAGEKKTIEVTFPKDYPQKDLSEEKVRFDIELLEIKKKEFPEWSDEFVKEFEYDSISDFQKKTREKLESEKKRIAQQELNSKILDKILEDNPFNVPPTFVEQQRLALIEDMKKNLQQRGLTEDMVKTYFKKWGDDLDKKALFQVKSGLVLDHLAKEFKIEVKEDDIDKKLREMAATPELDYEEVKKYYSSSEEMTNNLKYAIREEKTFEKLVEQVQVK